MKIIFIITVNNKNNYNSLNILMHTGLKYKDMKYKERQWIITGCLSLITSPASASCRNLQMQIYN